MTRHLLTLDSIGRDGILVNLELATHLKAIKGLAQDTLAGGRLGLIFDKPSTRTRVSFEAAAWSLGMLPITLRPDELQLGRGETVADTARVLSRYLSALAIRTFEQSRVEELARHSTIPIINALTDDHHPCQALADVMTIQEEFGEFDGLRVAFIGDGNNVCHSLIFLAARLGVNLRIATPASYAPAADVLADAKRVAKETRAKIELFTNPVEAVNGVQAVYTDSWTSMGFEAEEKMRRQVFKSYQVNRKLMEQAGEGAVFMHCLPAHRGQEVTDEVLDGPTSVVLQQSENRMYVQKAILHALFT